MGIIRPTPFLYDDARFTLAVYFHSISAPQSVYREKVEGFGGTAPQSYHFQIHSQIKGRSTQHDRLRTVGQADAQPLYMLKNEGSIAEAPYERCS